MACTPLGTTTPVLGLCKPKAGETGWDVGVNGNYDTLDAVFANATLTANRVTFAKSATALQSSVNLTYDGTTFSLINGDFILSNLKALRSVNAASSSTIVLIDLDGTNQIRLAIGGGNIVWGTPLVALGGGAAPTLGTIGGSGPATAGQNTWMKVVDSTGVAFWVPAWK